jgi:hypothetical protein
MGAAPYLSARLHAMKTKLLIIGTLAIGFAMVCPGCLIPGAKPPTPEPKVRIVAYINVTSGCQAATVDLLKSFPTKYPGVAVEFVDFGDAGAGTHKWEAAGLHCMTIQFNGNSIVKYPVGGKSKVMGFRMPAGFIWTHEDLEQAVQAAAAGTLQPATEEEWDQGGEPTVSPEQLRKQQQSKQGPEAGS